MSLEQLRGFVAVAEEAHFGRAARRLGASQPALSRSIQRLEEELGVALLERSGRGVRLAPAGAAFLGHARELLERVALARSAALGGASVVAPLRLGAVDVGAERALLGSSVVERGGQAGAARRLELSRASDARLSERLASGELDAIVVRRLVGASSDARFSAERLASDELVAVRPRDPELRTERDGAAVLLMRMGAPVEGPVVLVTGGCSPTELEASRYVAARPGLRVAALVQSQEAALLLAERGVGAAIVPRSALAGGSVGWGRVASIGAPSIELVLLRRRGAEA